VVTYTQLAGLTYTLTVPAGSTYKVVAHAFGTTFNVGSAYNDITVQYDFFLNGTAANTIQRVTALDGSSSLPTTPAPWSISNAWTLTAGTYTISVRGGHSGPAWGNSLALLCDVSGNVAAAKLTLEIFQ
jgi:hypothetical protein